MKLNPFSKKSNRYLDKIKAEHDALNQELTPPQSRIGGGGSGARCGTREANPAA